MIIYNYVFSMCLGFYNFFHKKSFFLLNSVKNSLVTTVSRLTQPYDVDKHLEIAQRPLKESSRLLNLYLKTFFFNYTKPNKFYQKLKRLHE